MIKYSIATTVWLGLGKFFNLLESIKKFTNLEDKEIIVISNHDPNNPDYKGRMEKLKAIEGINLHLMGYNALFTRATNKAIELAKGEYICEINPDCEILEKDWLEKIVACMEEHKAGVAGVKLVRGGLIMHAGAAGGGMHIGLNQPENEYNQASKVEWVTGACIVFKKEVAKKIGGFPMGPNNSWGHFGSDREFCRNAKKAGYQVIYCPVKVGHLWGRSGE